jgi:hypothetical protein
MLILGYVAVHRALAPPRHGAMRACAAPAALLHAATPHSCRAVAHAHAVRPATRRKKRWSRIGEERGQWG